MIKIACDVHGVITKHPKMFSMFSKFVIENGGQFHILTGSQLNKKLLAKLETFDIEYTKIFSISTYLLEQGKSVHWDDPDNPWFEEEVWDKAKADYCQREGIVLHMDDSKDYEKYFQSISTKYLHVK